MILVALGGKSHDNPYHSDYTVDLGRRLKSALKGRGGSVLIASSRRTPEPALSALMNELSGIPSYTFNWNADPKEENPYAAGLALADYAVVTGDSLSMMADVV